MPSPRPSPASDGGEQERAFLQQRVALFWKVIFFIILLSSGLGAVGAVVTPGVEFFITLFSGATAGVWWWLCARGQRSIRFVRTVEVVGLFVNLTTGAFLGRYLGAAFVSDHALLTAEGSMMAEAYLMMVQQGGTTMMVAIRAALVPSGPRRTAIVTAVIGIPMLVVSSVVVAAGHHGLAWRAASSPSYPWMPGAAVMMWGFTVITCTVISWVIYGLRAEVREARKLGQYVLEKKIGEGGMGEVYRASHRMMRRPCALKLLRAERAGELDLQRFEREVQLTARLTHPNTITIFDYGRTDDGVFYYAMELLQGANLQRIVALDGPQPAGRVVRILTMACGALAEAHAIGLIHRDIKPANIMLCTQGGDHDVVKLLDFGLVKELTVDRDVKLTGATSVMGTPLYMAPEAIRDPEAVDVRTDLYALGAVAYYLLTGGEVFDGKSVLEVFGQHLHEAPKPPSVRGVVVPAELEAVVLACLAKAPGDRPQSALELRRRLDACPVERWDDAKARAWWTQHQPALDAEVADDARETRTLAVDARATTHLAA